MNKTTFWARAQNVASSRTRHRVSAESTLHDYETVNVYFIEDVCGEQ